MTDHVCSPESCPAPGAYFVSVRNDSGTNPDWRPLLGPFPAHEIALAWLPRGKNMALDLDPRASFYAFGTTRLENHTRVTGLLMPLIEEELMPLMFEEDELVQATSPGVSVETGEKGRVIETGCWDYIRVYWPGRKLVAYHLATALRRLGTMGPEEET